MRVLICTWPAAAHLFPGIPLAWALRAAGHEVRVASHPSLSDAVTGAGLTAVPFGEERDLPQPLGAGRPLDPSVAEDLEQLTKLLDLSGHDRYLWSYHRDYLLPALRDFQPHHARDEQPQPALDAMVDFCRSWRPDLVLWDPTMPAAGVAATVSGAAQARLLWGPDLFGWAWEQYERRRVGSGGDLPVEEPLTSSVTAMARRYDLDVTPELVLGQWTVNPVIAGMRLPSRARTVPMRWVPYTGRTVLPTWLHAPPERPRVAITLGSSVRAWGRESGLLVNRVLEAVDGLDVEVVATLDASQLDVADRVPDNVRVIDYLPLSELLPTCSAVIHHGGHGTFGAALAAQIPQLVVMDPRYPMEAPLTSRFLVQAGAGTGVRADQHTGAELRAGLQRLIGETTFSRAASALYADLLAAPDPAETVPVLERLTRHHQSRA